MIETVFSAVSETRWPDELDRLGRQPRREPFDAMATKFVSTLSSRILRSPLAREFPELAALAHWFRRANVVSMGDQSRGASGAPHVRPRGLIFMIAPSNVDVLFMYGWLLSLLAGNASVIRVSQKASPIRDAFLGVVQEVVAESAFAPVVADSWLVTYSHDDSITARISAVCDARLVWGGDATVSRIRAIPIKPVAVEAGFADRFSLAAFSAVRVCADDEATLREIARRFANDTLWFAQQACSSPRAVFWIGDALHAKEAADRFWRLYEAAAATFENEPAAVMSRVTDLFMLAGVGAIDALLSPLAALPARASGRSTLADVREIHSGHGMFVEYVVSELRDVAGLMEDKDQTVVAHGFDDAEIDLLLRSLPNRAIDRIVSPGQATDFSTVWDGSDLLDILTRKVVVAARIPSGPTS